MTLFNSILETIGKTPIVRLNKMVPPGSAEVFCKLESFNPMSSVKDLTALSMIEDAEGRGELRSGMTVIEATSGNTGIGLAMVCAAKGYPLVLTMPETMSQERRKLLKAFGAELVLTPGGQGMGGAVERAKEIHRSNPDLYLSLQFDNPANPLGHSHTTAQDIIRHMPDLDAFVAGVGTGGTITGVGMAIKTIRKEALVVAVEPSCSPVLSGGQPGPHGIQGIGAGFVPKVLDMRLIDRIMQVTEQDAIATRALAKSEGILAGISSGAALWAALEVAGELGEGKKVVAILPDTGERYLSTGLFQD